jgi:hypothetical protein
MTCGEAGKLNRLVFGIRCFPVFFLIIAIASISHADSLSFPKVAENVRLNGKIFQVKDGLIDLILHDGAITQVKWAEVSELTINDRVVVTLTSGEKIFGILTLQGPDIHITSPTLGSVRFAKELVRAIGREQKEPFPVVAQSRPQEMAAVRGRGSNSNQGEKRGQEDAETRETTPAKPQTVPAEKKKDLPTIGVKPEERTPEEAFLRRDKVLVPKGAMEAEVGIFYSDNASVGLLGFKDRYLTFPLTARLGLTNKLLTYVTVPLAVSWRENPGEDKSSIRQISGVSDVRFGLQYQLFTERVVRPDVMFFISGRANTGKSPYDIPVAEASLGTGHWQIEPGFSLVKTYDPVVFFGSLSYTHFFPGYGRQPGDAINPQLGIGFALNDEVAMSFRTVGSFIFRSKVSGREVGRVLTPFSLVFSVDKYLTKNSYLEPSVAIGLTDEATDFTFGILYVHRFSLW